jgi:hypothetical protein
VLQLANLQIAVNISSMPVFSFALKRKNKRGERAQKNCKSDFHGIWVTLPMSGIAWLQFEMQKQWPLGEWSWDVGLGI